MDWDVGQGGVNAKILETGTTTATNRSSITVRYDTKSPTAAEADTAWVQAKKNGTTKTKKRTVFSVSWSLKFAGNLHADNNLRFSGDTGDNRDKCEFNWDGENNAERVAAKMEAICSFSPTGIEWSERGVTFKFSQDGGGAKFNFRLHRKRIATFVGQLTTESNRKIRKNDAGWVYDGNSDPGDAQNPTDMKPDRAFRIDEPGFDPDAFKQEGFRADLREIAEWKDGIHLQWRQISVWSQGEWYVNATAVLPDGSQGGSNNDGTGGAENVPNTRPAANAGADQTVDSGDMVTLDGSGSSDADNDTLTYKWTQTAGPEVTLSDDTAEKPTFTAPTGPATLKFSLKVRDITNALYHHKPDNFESTADSVTITVNAPP